MAGGVTAIDESLDLNAGQLNQSERRNGYSREALPEYGSALFLWINR